MKKFTKLMLAAAAVTAVSAAMAVSTLAADTITGSYNAEDGVVTLTGVEPSGDQQTLLVLSEDTDVTDANAGEIIKQIDQDASIAKFNLKPGLTEGTYYIRMGGSNGTIQTGTLTIGGSSAETVTIVIGDVDGGGDIGGRDGVFLARYLADFTTNIGHANERKTTPAGDEIVIGDVDGGGDIGGRDGVFLARYLADFTTNIGHANEKVEVLK